MAKDSQTGKGGGFTLLGVQLTITKWSSKGKKEMGDSTDSSNYDPATQQLWAAQLPGKQSQELSIEGNWSRSQTPSGLIALLKSDPPVTATLSIDPSTPFCSGNYDLSEVDIDLDVTSGDPISFTATLMSNGKVTYN